MKQDEKKKAAKFPSPPPPRKFWFEKFMWFISAENYLVIGGKDVTQNEQLVRYYLHPGDIFVHADLAGAECACCIVKNPAASEAEVPLATLAQAGASVVCCSPAWNKQQATSAWWVYHNQVSKTSPSGATLDVGTFLVRGKKNYLPPQPFQMGIAIIFCVGPSDVEGHKQDRVGTDDDSDREKGPPAVQEGRRDFLNLNLERYGLVQHNYDATLDQVGSWPLGGPGNEPPILLSLEDGPHDGSMDGCNSSSDGTGITEEHYPLFPATPVAPATPANNGTPMEKRMTAKERRRVREQKQAQGQNGGRRGKDTPLDDDPMGESSTSMAIDDEDSDGIDPSDSAQASVLTGEAAFANLDIDSQDEGGAVPPSPPPSPSSTAAAAAKEYEEGSPSTTSSNTPASAAPGRGPTTGLLAELVEPDEGLLAPSDQTSSSGMDFTERKRREKERRGWEFNMEEIHSLVATPKGEDQVLFAMPMCAPYASLVGVGCHLRARLVPGKAKRSKVAEAVVKHFSARDLLDNEREALRCMETVLVTNSLISNTTLVIPEDNLPAAPKGGKGKSKGGHKDRDSANPRKGSTSGSKGGKATKVGGDRGKK